MTDEQICELAKDKALDIQKYIIDGNVDIDSFAKKCCLAGAHSRDEEINKLKDIIERQKAIIAFDDLTEEVLRKELNQLRNPWISVEDRLPEKLENDCVSDYVLTRIDGPRQVWYLVNKYNYAIKAWEGCNNNTTHWMPIQELKKGE